jgi:hypothetical protein
MCIEQTRNSSETCQDCAEGETTAALLKHLRELASQAETTRDRLHLEALILLVEKNRHMPKPSERD